MYSLYILHEGENYYCCTEEEAKQIHDHYVEVIQGCEHTDGYIRRLRKAIKNAYVGGNNLLLKELNCNGSAIKEYKRVRDLNYGQLKKITVNSHKEHKSEVESPPKDNGLRQLIEDTEKLVGKK